MKQQGLIYLMGFMASGKSYWGQKIAAALQYNFIDLDDYLEHKTGQTISEIFAQSGEAHFRMLEKKYLKELSQSTNTIVSLGGGTPCSDVNILQINQTGISFFLAASVPTIILRLQKETDHRPLLNNKTPKELQIFIHQKLADRIPFYEKANYIINTEKNDVMNEILKHLIPNQ